MKKIEEVNSDYAAPIKKVKHLFLETSLRQHIFLTLFLMVLFIENVISNRIENSKLSENGTKTFFKKLR